MRHVNFWEKVTDWAHIKVLVPLSCATLTSGTRSLVMACSSVMLIPWCIKLTACLQMCAYECRIFFQATSPAGVFYHRWFFSHCCRSVNIWGITQWGLSSMVFIIIKQLTIQFENFTKQGTRWTSFLTSLNKLVKICFLYRMLWWYCSGFWCSNKLWMSGYVMIFLYQTENNVTELA